MHETFIASWTDDGRGFWTKRKRATTSLLTVLALIAGIAVAYKLFDQTVPNNVVRDASTFDYEVLKMDTMLGETAFTPAGATNPIYAAGVDTFPGDERTVDVRIINEHVTPPLDATFLLHVDQDSIVVRECVGDIDPATGDCDSMDPVDPNDVRYAQFLAFWTLRVEKQEFERTLGFTAASDDYALACESGLRDLTPEAPCNLGIIHAAGSTSDTPSPLPGNDTDLDRRDYRFNLFELDDGTDQSEFKGWEIEFTFVFNAKIPADPIPTGLLIVTY